MRLEKPGGIVNEQWVLGWKLEKPLCVTKHDIWAVRSMTLWLSACYDKKTQTFIIKSIPVSAFFSPSADMNL